MKGFASRHIGPDKKQLGEMLKETGISSLDELIEKAVPAPIRSKGKMDIPPAMSEWEFAAHIRNLAEKNRLFKNYIGMGYHPTATPAVITRNIFENPGWYTAYTPYQAEISQGRLEALLNYQTMIAELTGLPMANASLLDEGTAAAEAMIMLFNTRSKEQKKDGVNKFFVSDTVFPQTTDVIKTRASMLGIEVVVGETGKTDTSSGFFGAIVQYPAAHGNIENLSLLVEKWHGQGVKVIAAADLLSLALLAPPGQWGADVAVGSTQRFGLPMGFGGPHAGYFATREEYKRDLPGRIIGVSVDKSGRRALRMALQTREQHIKRERATSNICTSSVLVAIMAGMYGVYHGAEGLKAIAGKIHSLAGSLENGLAELGFRQLNENYFDTLLINAQGLTQKIRTKALAKGINLNYIGDDRIGISLNETTDERDIDELLAVFAEAAGKKTPGGRIPNGKKIPDSLLRANDFMIQDVFNRYHSETEMMRYIKRLENKDISLNHSMIPLGSCTMKLNAAALMMPLSDPRWGCIHPFVPEDQAQGYIELLTELEKYLSVITGLDACSLQPNSGASGEYAGLTVIRRYLASKGQSHRNICLIPASAHGTNPASAAMAGLQIVTIRSNENGTIDIEDLRKQAEANKDNLGCVMVTYPSTYGIFESGIREICDIVHRNGGQVYMDGANMNAQVGLTSPGAIGADVCHLNLHKTFAMPHGGGGPGVGAICVKEHLEDFLPGSVMVETDRKSGALSSALYGSSLLDLISYGYIRMLGPDGLTDATRYAILNANYLKAKLGKYYPVLYSGENGACAHEMILDIRPIKEAKGIDATDIAKRLMDYGYHAPTLSFPVPGTLMVEPTESENKDELDRFCEAMINIHKEIEACPEVLKNAPHPMHIVCSDNWTEGYSRERAAFPLPWVAESKVWPTVQRIDDGYGDRNLVCRLCGE